MKISYTMLPGRGDGGLLFHDIAQRLTAQGFRVAGLVQTGTRGPDRHPCDMDLKVLPEGRVIRISQSLGAGSRGCRLDAGALEQAAVEVAQALSRGADLVIVNKFGKLEAQGRGFRDVIGDAVAAGIPVLLGVNDLDLEAFLDFTDGLATALPPRRDALEEWVHRSLEPAAAEAGMPLR